MLDQAMNEADFKLKGSGGAETEMDKEWREIQENTRVSDQAARNNQ